VNTPTDNQPTKQEQYRFYGTTVLISILICILYFLNVPNYILGWIAFSVAAFSVAGNDAIQTIGTFIESKKESPFIIKAGIFVGLLYIVHLFGWIMDDRELHFHRLDSFPEPESYNLLQLLAPCILVIITRMKAPISTTFLILGLFNTGKSGNIEKMLTKSFLGYGISFLVAMFVWGLLAKFQSKEYNDEYEPDPKPSKFWSNLQWISTIFLWISWLLQDTANIAVYLPRKLSLVELIFAVGAIGMALAFIIYQNGGTIQEVVTEKTDLKSAKSATIVDLVYAGILLIFQKWSKMPMSTTWVFLGLLAGREIILHIVTQKDRPYLETFRQVGKDVLLASLGIAASISIYMLSTIVYPPENLQSLKNDSIIDRYTLELIEVFKDDVQVRSDFQSNVDP
jgi:hypothetical protein